MSQMQHVFKDKVTSSNWRVNTAIEIFVYDSISMLDGFWRFGTGMYVSWDLPKPRQSVSSDCDGYICFVAERYRL